MTVDDFTQTWQDIARERGDLAAFRDDLETKLAELRTKISRLDEVLNNLAPLTNLPIAYYDERDVSKLGLTDAIRFVLRNSQQRLSAHDVRKLLLEKRYDLSGLTAEMASIYKILSRLSEGDSAEVDREKEDGRVFYRWKPEIKDEDIPF